MVNQSDFRGACPTCGWWIPNNYSPDNCTKCGSLLSKKTFTPLGEPRADQSNIESFVSAPHANAAYEASLSENMRALNESSSPMSIVFWLLAFLSLVGGAALTMIVTKDLVFFYAAVTIVNFALFAGAATVISHLHSINATLKRMERSRTRL